MRAAFFTLGCKLNQSESEALASSFKGRGFFIIPHTEAADIYIFNTCTVTSMAEQKARRLIRKVAREHPDSLIIITGCYAQLEAEQAGTLADNVLVLGQMEKHLLLELPRCLQAFAGEREPSTPEGKHEPRRIREAVEVCLGKARDEAERKEEGDGLGPFSYDPDVYSFHSRAFLKVQDGCDRKCGYCRVPLARGNSVSLDADTVIERAVHLEQTGYREIVLTGVNLTSYRFPRRPESGANRGDLPDLVKMLTEKLGSARLRLSSLEPEMVTESLARAASHPAVCPHFHLPVQSGSARVLRSVGRPYTAEEVQKAAARLRSAKEDPFIAADIIVGLPGETGEDFKETVSLIEECTFSRLHVFPYSRRPGTRLYRSHGAPVPERIAGERADILQRLSEELYRRYLRRWRGKKVFAVLEQALGGGFRTALSGNYLHLAVAGVPHGTETRGSLCSVIIGSEDVRGTPRAEFEGFI